MKVYVEKLPKECYCCVFNIEDVGGIGGYCIFGGGKKDCPLIPLADYTKQVRKEVCEEVYKKCEPLFRLVNNYDNGDVIERNELVDILDQLQGETK